MAVKGGDFFVALGLKGTDKTKAELEQTTDGFEALKTSATSAKLAVLAVFYGIEKIISTSGGLGTVLAQFAAISGMNTKTSQSYAIAAQPYGVSQQEMFGQFTAIKDEMIGAKFNAQDLRPFTLAMFNQLQEHGINIDLSKDALSQLAAHPEQMIQYEQQFANLEDIPLTERTAILDQRGDSQNLQAAFLGNAFSKESLNAASAMALSAETVRSLDETNKGWIKIKQHMAYLRDTVVSTTVGETFSPSQENKISLKRYLKSHPLEELDDYGHPIKNIPTEKHLVTHIHNTKNTNITHTSHVTLNGATAKDIPALKKAVSTDHSDLVALTTKAYQDR